MPSFTRVCKLFALLALAALSLAAQTTTVTGTPSAVTNDPVSGTVTLTPVAVASSGSERVLAVPVTVSFANGALSVPVLPTDTMTPALSSGSYKYRVTYSVPLQTVNGHRVGPASYGPCYWTVPSSPSSVNVGNIESCTSTVVAPVSTVALSQLTATGTTDGTYCLQVSGGKITGLTACSSGGGALSLASLTNSQLAALTNSQLSTLGN